MPHCSDLLRHTEGRPVTKRHDRDPACFCVQVWPGKMTPPSRFCPRSYPNWGGFPTGRSRTDLSTTPTAGQMFTHCPSLVHILSLFSDAAQKGSGLITKSFNQEPWGGDAAFLPQCHIILTWICSLSHLFVKCCLLMFIPKTEVGKKSQKKRMNHWNDGWTNV